MVGRGGAADMLISCIMPTRNRPEFAWQAVKDFLLQDYAPWCELIIVDDADAPSFPVPPTYERVKYFSLDRRLKIGAKRNFAIEQASPESEVIAHWDDDDHSAPRRLGDQSLRLFTGTCRLTGYHSMVFDDGRDRWLKTEPQGYAIGTSMMYWRSFWEQHPFRDLQMGEDTIFLGYAQRSNSVITAPAGDLMVARIHPGNTITKRPEGRGWEKVAA
jgi:glycosyltransferase involved in cell wall biosynthesis